MAKYAVVRLDRMSGTDDGSKILSGRFYKGTSGTLGPAEIENGNVVHLTGELLDREVFKVLTPTSDDKKETIGLVASVEMDKDSCCVITGLNDFINKADGEPQRIYRLETGDIFSVTAEAIEGTPKKNNWLKLGSTTKWVAASASTDAIATIIDVETVGGRTFYVAVVK